MRQQQPKPRPRPPCPTPDKAAGLPPSQSTYKDERTLGLSGVVHGVHQLLHRGLQIRHLCARRVALLRKLAHERLLARGEPREEALGRGGRAGRVREGTADVVVVVVAARDATHGWLLLLGCGGVGVWPIDRLSVWVWMYARGPCGQSRMKGSVKAQGLLGATPADEGIESEAESVCGRRSCACPIACTHKTTKVD